VRWASSAGSYCLDRPTVLSRLFASLSEERGAVAGNPSWPANLGTRRCRGPQSVPRPRPKLRGIALLSWARPFYSR
jgi:hypothetical protein